MDMIKKFFPFSFNFKEKDTNGLIVSIVIYIVLMLVSGVAMWLLGFIPLVNYVAFALGIVFAVLNFFNVLK